MPSDNVHLRDGDSPGHQRPTRRRQVIECDPRGGDFHQGRPAAGDQRQKQLIGMALRGQRKGCPARRQAGPARIRMISHHHLQPRMGRGPVVIGDDQAAHQAGGQKPGGSAGHAVRRLPHRQDPHSPPGFDRMASHLQPIPRT